MGETATLGGRFLRRRNLGASSVGDEKQTAAKVWGVFTLERASQGHNLRRSASCPLGDTWPLAPRKSAAATRIDPDRLVLGHVSQRQHAPFGLVLLRDYVHAMHFSACCAQVSLHPRQW